MVLVGFLTVHVVTDVTMEELGIIMKMIMWKLITIQAE